MKRPTRHNEVIIEGCNYMDLLICENLDKLKNDDGSVHIKLTNGRILNYSKQRVKLLSKWAKDTRIKLDTYENQILWLDRSAEFHYDYSELLDDIFLRLKRRLEALQEVKDGAET